MRAQLKSAYALASKSVATITSTIAVCLFSRRSSIRQERRENELLVLGNGPSLSIDLERNPDLARGRDVMCVNDLVKSEIFSRLQPRWYVVLDPYYWQTTLSSEMLREREEFFDNLVARTAWPLILLAPFECESAEAWPKDIFKRNPLISVRYFNRTPFEGFAVVRNWFFKQSLAMPWAQNVLVATLYLAINLGYRNILLLGADHSWHEELQIGDDNVVRLRQLHCYDATYPEEGQPVSKMSVAGYFKMDELFEAWSRAFRGHRVIRDYADSLKVGIVNASAKSYIDAYPRKSSRDI